MTLFQITQKLKKSSKIIIPIIIIIIFISIIVLINKPKTPKYNDLTSDLLDNPAVKELQPSWYMIDPLSTDISSHIEKLSSTAVINSVYNKDSELTANIELNTIIISDKSKTVRKTLIPKHSEVYVYLKWIDKSNLLIIEKEKSTFYKYDYLYLFNIIKDSQVLITDSHVMPGRIDFQYDISILPYIYDGKGNKSEIIRLEFKETGYDRAWILRFFPSKLQ